MNKCVNQYYHADGNGNITFMMTAQQTEAARYVYDPFGNELSHTGPLADANHYRFSSKELHPNSGLYYYLYRYYDPILQRWVNCDPLGDDAFNKPKAIRSTRAHVNKNLYWFVMNNPIRYWDYFGLDNPGCDSPGDKTIKCPSQKDCILRCCAQHDKCYYDNACKSDSWYGTAVVDWLGAGLVGTPCQNCNNKAASCIIKCRLGIPSDDPGPRWFCPNGRDAGKFYDDYEKIPSSCWENGKKPPTPQPDVTPPAPQEPFPTISPSDPTWGFTPFPL